ncbi:hypothetical protein FOXB_15804 [Fusarium oxysporum f. sp. conglutinans Fo5176]|uniref:Uncharacterized protein n=1 Tax=Fusarium oxysporum (strain Fo5176) TaxID=660025 RepID=F9GAX2_FUSOF|nr:hypothetical protein FOXB_15804 [Fusarium oxysporum f. sp. conglutinans Fo5176]
MYSRARPTSTLVPETQHLFSFDYTRKRL